MADNTMLMDACLTECEIRKKVLLSILSLVMPCASSVSLPSMDLSANMHFFSHMLHLCAIPCIMDISY